MQTAITKDIYLPEPATILKTQALTATEKFFVLKNDSGKPLGHMPGQFIEISVAGIGEAPISISSPPYPDATFELGIRAAGNVTKALHRLKEGDKVGIRGPFGTTFPVETAMKGKDLVFVCGGLGLIPLRSAIKYVLEHRNNYGKVYILSGTRSPSTRLFIDELAQWEKRTDVVLLETVDQADGNWTKRVGVVTTLFQDITLDSLQTVGLIVGPPVMYKFVLLEFRKIGVSDENIYVSLERHMKCGVGKCGHCQINGLYTCQDGPVFRYADISKVREAI